MVRTNIVNVERNRPERLGNEPVPLTPEMQAGKAAFTAAMDAGMYPARVADIVFDAIQKEKFYPHPSRVDGSGPPPNPRPAAH
jgi:hypothetical protein